MIGMPPPRVSVVVPTYNRLPLLRETLSTLLAQDEPNLEIVVVDNASTDGTADAIERLDAPRLRVVRGTETISLAANWSRALHAGQGDYLALYHDDDLYAPSVVSRCRAVLDAHPEVGLVHVGATRFTNDGRDLGPWTRSRSSTELVRSGRLEALRWVRNIHDIAPSTIMLRRSVFLQVGDFAPDLCACTDFEFFVRLALRADIAFVAEPPVRVRWHSVSSTTGITPEEWVREVNRVLESSRDHFAAANLAPPPEGWDAVGDRLRACFGRRIRRLELSLWSHGHRAAARRARSAANQLDHGPLGRAAAIGLAATGPTGLLQALGTVYRWTQS